MPHHLSSEWINEINEIPTVPICYLAKPQPRERAWQNQRGKKTLLSLTLVRLCEKHERCRIGGSSGENEIPLYSLFFYLFNEVEADLMAHRLALRLHAGRSRLKTVSDGEFGWGGTSVK